MTDVSIIIPSYNRAAEIGDAVRSCMAQSVALEVIVVDDGSSDNTRETLQTQFGLPAVQEAGAGCTAAGDRGVLRYVVQDNQGAAAARNRGLDEAAGAYVKFLDSDDELVEGALKEELRMARDTGADVVVSAWEERTRERGRERRVRRNCPRMERGIDDMLRGESPWTAAALYRRDFIQSLRWDADFGKADDWGWAWTVCLAGARHAMLDKVTAVYRHHDGDRITSRRDAFEESTAMRQRILTMVEATLMRDNALTEERRIALAQYYYKDRVVICRQSPAAWRRLWRHCRHLAPAFRPVESHRVLRPFVRILGPCGGVCLYVTLHRWFRGLSRLCGGWDGQVGHG